VLHARISVAAGSARQSTAGESRREYLDDKETDMFVRQVSAQLKPGKFDLLNRKLEDEVIPLLKKQKGFRDELSFFDKKKDEAFAMSFWDTKQDAESYQRDIYPRISKEMEGAYEGTPTVRSFEVNNSTWYDIHAA
jgi:heme-degrading monooxygenase HmoA